MRLFSKQHPPLSVLRGIVELLMSDWTQINVLSHYAAGPNYGHSQPPENLQNECCYLTFFILSLFRYFWWNLAALSSYPLSACCYMLICKCVVVGLTARSSSPTDVSEGCGRWMWNISRSFLPDGCTMELYLSPDKCCHCVSFPHTGICRSSL